MSKSASAILSYCKVTESSSTTSPVTGGGSNTVSVSNTYHFKASSIYLDKGVSDATGIVLIKSDDWKGDEPLISVGQMIGSGKVERLYALVAPEDTTKPNKRIAILCQTEKVKTAKGSDATTGLVGKTLKTTRGSVAKTLGTVIRLGAKVSDHFI
jgi:hypothetical protein